MITTYNLYGPVEQTKVDLVTLGGNSYPAGKITEKAMWMSVFLTKRYRILNADSTKTPFYKISSFVCVMHCIW